MLQLLSLWVSESVTLGPVKLVLGFIPVIVPWTTVPFFSSICTLSLLSFIRKPAEAELLRADAEK